VPAPEPITRKKTYELVAERLVAEIGERRLSPGDPLPTERQLTQQYRVGRSSIREALRMLESQGLIEARGSGMFSVAEFQNPLNQSLSLLLSLDASNLREFYEMRTLIEGELAALAAERRTDEDLGRMLTALQDMRAGLESEQLYIDADVRFHLAIADATKNRFALHMMQALRELLHRALSSVYHIPGSPATSLEQHQQILDAIAAGRSQEARDGMQEHLLRVERDIERALVPSAQPAPEALRA
jgi:GntR family transcriptional regulator, transcriptional repressor for pyruvate dehydrogenase complex